jgi:hypothetical protein
LPAMMVWSGWASRTRCTASTKNSLIRNKEGIKKGTCITCNELYAYIRRTHTRTHTQMHTHTHTQMHTHTHKCTHTHTQMHTHTLTHTHTLSHTHTCTLTHTHTLTLTLSHTQCTTYSPKKHSCACALSLRSPSLLTCSRWQRRDRSCGWRGRGGGSRPGGQLNASHI